MAKLIHIKTEPSEKYGFKITCERRSWFHKPDTVVFVGSSTVFHSYPDGRRQPTWVEAWLSEVCMHYKFSTDNVTKID